MKTATQAAEYTNDELTKAVTAYDRWADLTAACSRGFLPTLMQLPGRGPRTARRNKLTAELAQRLEQSGHQVWRGSR